MDRRRASLVLLMLFVACTGVAIVVGGSRPGLQQGVAPTAVQFAGYAFALVAGVLLLLRPFADPGDQRTGVLVLVGLAILVAVEVVSQGGTGIGAGGVRLIGLVVLAVASVRLAQGLARTRRTQ
jgi:hypothetical protein